MFAAIAFSIIVMTIIVAGRYLAVSGGFAWLRLPRTAGNTLLKFRSGSEDTADLVGELLCALMRPQTQ